MFDSIIYSQRRKNLLQKISNGIILFPGNNNVPRNFGSMSYPFRQDSSFLYYWGLDFPNLSALIDTETNEEIIFGDDRPVDDIVWMGPDTPMVEKAENVGVSVVKPGFDLKEYLTTAISNGKKIHYLPQYRSENVLFLSELLGINPAYVNKYVSNELIKAVADQRSVKSGEEVMEIEKALDISYEMYITAMKMIREGLTEKEVCGHIESIANIRGAGVSFGTILSVRGEILHNESYNNTMQNGDMVLLDSGAETDMHYASDITRVIPVSGKFSDRQKEIYNVVLNSQLKAIKMIKPGIKYKDIHLTAAKVIADGLKQLGLMKGDISSAVEQGAHALFFPHGLGHMMGLDVHDMESLGEDYIGYDDKVKRSNQFGLAYLRLGKELKEGYVLTVEPGVYFIPALIDQWKNENKFAGFIDYDEVEKYRNFGGIRIEDDILVTGDGYRVLGKPIPKTVEEVEEYCGK